MINRLPDMLDIDATPHALAMWRDLVALHRELDSHGVSMPLPTAQKVAATLQSLQDRIEDYGQRERAMMACEDGSSNTESHSE